MDEAVQWFAKAARLDEQDLSVWLDMGDTLLEKKENDEIRLAAVNILDVVGASMGLQRNDHFKRLKMKQDADLILDDCREMLAHHGLDREAARPAIEKALLGEQPLRLRGSSA